MEKVKKFDTELRKQYSYQFLMSKVVYGIFFVVGSIMMCIPFTDSKEMELLIIPVMLFSWGVILYLSPYMIIHENGISCSVYEKLKWMPILKKEIRRIRIGYLNQICIKIGILSFLLQQIGALLEKNWKFSNLFYPVGTILVVWLLGVCYIYTVGMRSKR